MNKFTVRVFIAAGLLILVFFGQQQLRVLWSEWDGNVQVHDIELPSTENGTVAEGAGDSTAAQVNDEGVTQAEGTAETTEGDGAQEQGTVESSTGDSDKAGEASNGDAASGGNEQEQGDQSSASGSDASDTDHKSGAESAENDVINDPDTPPDAHGHDFPTTPSDGQLEETNPNESETQHSNPSADQNWGEGENQAEEWQPPKQEDKIVVMARMAIENVDWVEKYLPEWQRAIYVVDDPNAEFKVPKNKGREAMAYLTYIIDKYPMFPSVVAFIHPHQVSWHTDGLIHSNTRSLQLLNVDFVERNGYANLRCSWTPGCPDEIQPFRPDKWKLKQQERWFPQAWEFMFNGTLGDVPGQVGVSCCSQFAVSKKQILSRPVEDYERYRQWLLDTVADDETSGRVLEYLWHIIFGKSAV
ncbi:MAG: hypothetical protein M1834_007504 [Cirrosporium novae-zelandiae]|nr:MAG: hypothetical protein M1834_007504 [Cirrosporium novae-zelandiae]